DDHEVGDVQLLAAEDAIGDPGVDAVEHRGQRSQHLALVARMRPEADARPERGHHAHPLSRGQQRSEPAVVAAIVKRVEPVRGGCERDPAGRHLEYLIPPRLCGFYLDARIWIRREQGRLRAHAIEKASYVVVRLDALAAHQQRGHGPAAVALLNRCGRLRRPGARARKIIASWSSRTVYTRGGPWRSA